MKSGNFIGIDDNRLFHLRGVAQRCYDIGLKLGFTENRSRELYVLGFLHDIGYRYSVYQTEHEAIGGELLRSLQYKDSEIISQHGDPSVQTMSLELLILNIADMQTSRDGNPTDFNSRLSDIKERYGEKSPQYNKASQLTTRILDEISKRKIDISILEV